MSRRHSPTCAVKDANMDHRLWEHCAKTFTYVTESIFMANPLNGHWLCRESAFCSLWMLPSTWRNWHEWENASLSPLRALTLVLLLSLEFTSRFFPPIFPSLSSPLGVLYWTRQFSSALPCTHIRPTGSSYALFFLEITGRAGQSPWNSISCVS